MSRPTIPRRKNWIKGRWGGLGGALLRDCVIRWRRDDGPAVGTCHTLLGLELDAMVKQMNWKFGKSDSKRATRWGNSKNLMLAVSLLALSGGGVGCTSLNESNVMRGTDPMPAFQPSTSMVFTGAISVHGLDRTDWPTETVYVSVNDIETGRPFGTWWNASNQPSRRAAGLYPTHESALDLSDSAVDTQAEYAELFLEPVHQFVNSALIPFFLVTRNRPWDVSNGPMKRYVRAMPVKKILVPGPTAVDDVDE